MRQVLHDPEPLAVEGRTLSEITADIIALMQQGYPREEIRLLAGYPDSLGERFTPGCYFFGVLIV